MATISSKKVKEGNPQWLFALVANPADGTPAVPSDFDEINIKAFRLKSSHTEREQVGTTITLVPIDVMTATPVTDDLRYQTAEGYNFLYQLAGTHFANGKAKYQVEVQFTPTAGEPFLEVWTFETTNTYFYDAVEADA